MVAQLKVPPVNLPCHLPYTVEGLVQVFTSLHRTFFTTVMAQSLRIASQGTPVLVVQFLKGGIRQGPENPMLLGQNLHWIRPNIPRCIDTPHLDESEAIALKELWEYTKEAVYESKYSLVVLDELSLAINFGLLPEAEVLEFLEKRPRHVDIILSGPEMPPTFLEAADQITEIRREVRV